MPLSSKKVGPKELDDAVVLAGSDDDDDTEVVHSSKRSKKSGGEDIQTDDDAEAARLRKLKIPDLKELLRAKGLALSGSKETLVFRLVSGPAPVVVPGPSAVSYEWDPTDATKKVYCTEVATTGKGKCIRCLQCVEQGVLKIGFPTWGGFGPMTRW